MPDSEYLRTSGNGMFVGRLSHFLPGQGTGWLISWRVCFSRASIAPCGVADFYAAWKWGCLQGRPIPECRKHTHTLSPLSTSKDRKGTDEELQPQMTEITKIIAWKVNTWQTCDWLMIVLVCDHDNRHLTRPLDKWWIHHTTHEVSDIYHSFGIPCALYLHTRNIIVSPGFMTTESSRECYESRLCSDYKIYFLVKE